MMEGPPLLTTEQKLDMSLDDIIAYERQRLGLTYPSSEVPTAIDSLFLQNAELAKRITALETSDQERSARHPAL